MPIVESEGVATVGNTKRDVDMSRMGTADRERTIVQFIELPDLRRLHPAGKGDFPARLRDILSGGPLDATIAAQPSLENELIAQATALSARAYPSHSTTERQSARWIDHSARDSHHRALLALYQQHMRLPNHGLAVNQWHPLACRLTGILESAWERDTLARARAVVPLSDSDLPSEPGLFVEWYRRTAFTHPLYEHELYSFLASEATLEQIHWFFTMESAGEAAFDDLVALSQVGTRGDVKMEMASNYWDEMGNGKEHAVHTHLFHRLAADLDVTAPGADELPWQVLSGVNLMLWCSISRRNAFRAQGALGAVELLAPQRCTRVVHGAHRVGIQKKTMSYYGAHAIIDIGHAEGWLEHVVRAQVADIPDSRIGIAEGLVSRANASLDYFDYCLAKLRAQ
ncbi:MAG: iron-containing redox enzyme family protein [Gemmatimonadaceae bacterium]|nr:iron-containing redox enzyme family protein [Gemmatimonadaceae bacterium]